MMAHPSLADVMPAPGTRPVALYDYVTNVGSVADRIEAVLNKNPGVWLKMVKAAGDGHPLPYEPSFGVTRAEYQDVVSHLSPIIQGKKSGSANLTTEEALGQLTLKIDKGKVMAAGIRFDRASATFYVPGFHRTEIGYGVILRNVPGGPLKGYRWEVQATTEGARPSGQWATITIGKYEPSRECVIDVRFRKFADGKLLTDESVEARYQCGNG